MNKQEALAYIESGKEAVQARNEHSVSSGDPVRLLGYGYEKPGRWSHSASWKQREDWENAKRPCTNGVLVEYINPLHYKRFEVVPLRQLFATTRAEADAEYMRRVDEAEQHRLQAQEKHDSDVRRAERLIDILGGGNVNDRYGSGVVTILLSLDQAQELADELAHLGASRNVVVP